MDQVLRTGLSFQRKLRRVLAVAAIAGPVGLAPEMSSAENLLDFLFGGGQKQQNQPSLFGNIFNNNTQPASPRPAVAGSGPAFCVRSCDGKYFPLMRGAASPTQLCQAFCPASPTKIFFGSSIDHAYAATGERLYLQRPQSRRSGAGRYRDGRLVAFGRRARHRRRKRRLFQLAGRQRPGLDFSPLASLSARTP
jgi:hypothetical protein